MRRVTKVSAAAAKIKGVVALDGKARRSRPTHRGQSHKPPVLVDGVDRNDVISHGARRCAGAIPRNNEAASALCIVVELLQLKRLDVDANGGRAALSSREAKAIDERDAGHYAPGGNHQLAACDFAARCRRLRSQRQSASRATHATSPGTPVANGREETPKNRDRSARIEGYGRRARLSRSQGVARITSERRRDKTVRAAASF